MVEQGTPHEARSTQADDLNAAAAEVSNVETVAAEAAETLTDASQNLDDISADEVVVEGSPEVESASVAEYLYIEAKKQVEEWQGKYMRLHAEWDTYRRRTNEQREIEKARATEKLVTDLLPVIDDFERTIGYATDNGETGLLDGVKAVHAKFVSVLQKDGVEIIDPVGQPFDSLEAQAVATVPDSQEYDETVHEVYQKGYKMGTKVLRPAMVTVTTGGPKREKTPDEGSESTK